MHNDLSTTISDARDATARRAADLADQARAWWDRGSDLAHSRADALRLRAYRASQGTQRYLRAIARIQPDQTLASVNAEFATISDQLSKAYPDESANFTAFSGLVGFTRSTARSVF